MSTTHDLQTTKPPPFRETPAKPLVLGVYRVDNGAHYWIAADSLRAALAIYWEIIEQQGGDEQPSLKVRLVDLDEAEHLAIHDDDDGAAHSAAWLAAEATEPKLLGCSEW